MLAPNRVDLEYGQKSVTQQMWSQCPCPNSDLTIPGGDHGSILTMPNLLVFHLFPSETLHVQFFYEPFSYFILYCNTFIA
jgi:hypothetical protein